MTNAALLTKLTQQKTALETLRDALESELSLISARTPDALVQVVEQKQLLLDNIAANDKDISHLYTDDAAQQADVQQLIADVRKLVEECQYRSDINSKAVEQGQLRLTHLRNLIIESRHKESLTYDRTGKTTPGGKGRGYAV